MIIYHPAYDVHHCAYRFLLLSETIKKDIEWEKFRILDFFLLFPNLLKNLTLPAEIRGARKVFNNIPEPYENISNPSRLMFELGNIQNACVTSLMAKEILDKEAFASDRIKRTVLELPTGIKLKLDADPIRNESWFIYLANELSEIEFYGSKGFKARCGLMEYRYDNV